ncbi:hypothetical protein Tco_0360045 [Tanacetum coccineum]
MHEESEFEGHDMVSDDEDIGSRHVPKVNLNQDWFKPLSEDEILATPEPVWSIPSSSLPTDDIGVFIDWFCKKQGITELTLKHLEGFAYEVVKAFHPDVIHLQFQKEECHKLLTNQVDDRLLRYNVSRPLLLGGPPGQVMIQTEFFFNRDLDYLRFGSKGDRLALSITKMKVAYYPDVGLEQMVPNQMWIEEECMYDIFPTYGISYWWFKRQKFYIDRHSAETNRRAIVKTHMRILSVVKIEVFLIYGSPEPPTAKGQEDSLYCCQLMDQESGSQTTDAHALQQIDEALDYWVKEFKVNKNNPTLNTSSGESFGTWKALLVEEYAKETTDFYEEPNDDILFVASRTSYVVYIVGPHGSGGSSYGGNGDTSIPCGGGTGGRASSGGGRTRGRSSNQGDGRNDGSGVQIGGQGSEVNGGVDGVPDFSNIIAQ